MDVRKQQTTDVDVSMACCHLDGEDEAHASRSQGILQQTKLRKKM